ncbi:MAG: hypothetical protein ABWY13_20015 [Mesorhizobium sp.]|jgi:hypothetical protein
MTFLSQTRVERTGPRTATKARMLPLRDSLGALAFFLAIGFSVALVFGMIGN